MGQAQAAAGPDRLPWLEDEPRSRISHGHRRERAGWAAAAVLVLAGAAYWIGAHTGQPVPHTTTEQPATTVLLPQARPSEPAQPQVTFEPAPQVSPTPQREVVITRPPAEKLSSRRSRDEAAATAAAADDETAPSTSSPTETTASSSAPPESASSQPAKPAPATADKPLTAWPAWQSEGASGRIVRVGAFGTRQQAKVGWRYMVQAYPAVAHLKATVVGESNSRGRHFYRFQIGTTSQAHSEVLCQRMEKIRLSCAVVGLPWRPKGVER